MKKDDILLLSGLKEEEVLCIYPYGSRVYGTSNENSDYDFILVKKEDAGKAEIKTPTVNLTIYGKETFKALIKESEISVLECLFLQKDQIILEKEKFSYEQNLFMLRTSISQKSSNSWVKAKKKLIVKEDFEPYIAKKSLFHSFRILDYGVQLATHGQINNYSSMNDLWSEIKEITSTDWSVYQETFQKRHNAKKSEFKKLAPKQKD